MLINRKHKIIFIHVPKTAGKSIQKVFGINIPKVRDGYIVSNLHARSCEVKDRHLEEWSECFKFSVVRNPWDRYVSAYFHFKRFEIVEADASFQDFVIDPESTFTGKDAKAIRFIDPCSKWVDGVDQILRFENLEEEFAKMVGELGLNFQRLPKINVTKHDPYKWYYNKHLTKIVGDRYSEDVKVFGY